MMTFFVRDWDELAALPDLDRLTGQPGLVEGSSGRAPRITGCSALIPMARSAPA